MPDDHEDRAAMIEALRVYQHDNRPAGYTACFEAAWQARGEYEREQRERHLTALERLRGLIYDSYNHEYDGDGGCFEDCFVCEADLILLPALAETTTAPGEQR